MTEFERNAKYSYKEKLSYLKDNGYDSKHLQTFIYKGFKFILIDTAGIRQSSDVVESIGIKKSKDMLDSSDIILFYTQTLWSHFMI